MPTNVIVAAVVGVVVGFLIGLFAFQNSAGNKIVATLEREVAPTVAIPAKREGVATVAIAERGEAPTPANPQKDGPEPLVVLEASTGERISSCNKIPCKVQVKHDENGEPFLVDENGKPIKAQREEMVLFRFTKSICDVWYYGGSSGGKYWYWNYCGQVKFV